MNVPSFSPAIRVCGIHLSACREGDSGPQRLMDYLGRLGLQRFVCHRHEDDGVVIAVTEEFAQRFTPGFDTTLLCQQLDLATGNNSGDLEREIVLALLASPVQFEFPSFEEFASAVNIRRNIVQNARKTALAFDTEHAERPEDYWNYDLSTGFILKPGKPLIEALQKTTQPERSGKLYSFSCYRATEYVLLLSIAQELAECNPAALAQLQRQWEARAIMSGRFHEVFLHEYGSMAQPLPPRYYVPGDRLWFRNPDEQSSNVEGYEGSWVFYLGNGLFTNFWKREQPFTLMSKCVELFHWRNATYRNGDGKLQVNDDVVDARVAQSLQDPDEVDRIVSRMLRLRDPGGVYRDGGCVDTTRECARRVRPGTCQLAFDL